MDLDPVPVEDVSTIEGAGGGFYNSVMIDTAFAGCQYRVCAGGVYPCLSRECLGCIGCSSYVNGHNLSNFCAYGGSCGHVTIVGAGHVTRLGTALCRTNI